MEYNLNHYTSSHIGGQVGRSFSPRSGRSGIRTQVGSNNRLQNWHLMLAWLAFTI